MYGSSSYHPPVTNPPVTNPPVTNPPVTNPPVTNPPVTNPPVTNPPLTNNPFIENASHPSNRYPDISSPPSQPQWADPTLLTSPQSQYQPDIYQRYPPVQQPQQPQIHSGYTPQPPQFQPPQQPQIQPPNYPPPYQQPRPQPPQPTPSFQPSSSGSFGYPYSQPLSQQTTPAYNPGQQPLNNNPNYVPQDPYRAISQGWTPDTATPQSQQPLNPNPTSNSNSNFGGYHVNSNQNQNNNPLGFSPSGDPHPREYIRSHKQDIEAWDSYTWKQLLNSCEALQRSWESRRNELKTKLAGLQSQLRYAGYYDRTQIQREGDRIQALLNEAQSNFDSASASTFQFEESFKGYRQSGDTSSKKRVREATNAALQCLPKWPEP